MYRLISFYWNSKKRTNSLDKTVGTFDTLIAARDCINLFIRDNSDARNALAIIEISPSEEAPIAETKAVYLWDSSSESYIAAKDDNLRTLYFYA